MQFVKYSGDLTRNNKTLRFTNPFHSGHQDRPTRPWLPFVLLAGAVAAILSLGTHDRPGQEVAWLQRLAHEGDTGAQLQLGLAYRDGQYDLKPNPGNAFHWLKKAADNGNAYAEDAVGTAYANGIGVNKNEGLAERWWHKSIRAGNAEARIHLGQALLQQGHTREAEKILKP